MYCLYKDWYADDAEDAFRKITFSMWPYVLGAGVVSIYYRVHGIVFERSTDVGEILVAEGD